MGLDMFVFEAEKPSETITKKLKTIDDCYKYDLFVITEEDYIEEMYSDLLPFMSEVEILVYKTDFDRFKKDHKIPEDYYQSGFSSGYRLHFTYENRDHSDEIKFEISDNDFREKYVYQIPEKCYVVKLCETEYWRKYYALQSYIYEKYHEYTGKTIENCGYHRLSEEMLHELNENFFYEFDQLHGDNLFYHEWY